MYELYVEGGAFMMPLTLLGLVAVLLTIKKALDVFGHAEQPASAHRPMINAVLQVGIFSFFLGILSQAIGLLNALQAIEQMGNVAPAMVAGGLKVSMIAPIYGLLILLGAFIAGSALKYRCDALEADA